ncbi:MAG TPA: hypothetical protein VFH50_13865 [Acidimicrobiales bacterium]|nr:hypothetical protein [Acidimicrobiales bacterium]
MDPTGPAAGGTAGPDAWPDAGAGEDDLAAGGLLVELAHGDDVGHLGDEVVLLEPEQVDRGLAGVEAGARVGDHLDELRYRGDVELLHPLGHVVGHHRRHAGKAPEQGGEVEARIAHRRQLDVLVAAPVDGVHPEEGEEQVGFDPLRPCSVGHDQPGIDPVQGALGDDYRDLFDGVRHGSPLSSRDGSL